MQLLTPAGTKLALRYEMRQPFAEWVVAQVAAGAARGGAGALLLEGLRRFEVAGVQRRAPGQGLPRSYLQADLDFLLPSASCPQAQATGEAEVGRERAPREAREQQAMLCALHALPTHHLPAPVPPSSQAIACVADALCALPELGAVELRVGHRQLFEAALQFVNAPRDLQPSLVQLLSTAAAASPLHEGARKKRWGPIR